ncbi:hypothetical protein A0H81_04490 [Grifola frondosa]|uniref:Uncharacterized protein n=1 Tax=Grifola frondosa TaxID=5627 RepID=A0A1C7MKR4_GRIFR|nr:hypothetical protein A0H81_04490 [Grifola frondosa]
MATTTITETFDTQMTESGDIDIQMYSGSLPNDAWLSVEASMMDDTSEELHFPDLHAVEVDMEEYNDGITEYEMADEGDEYREELQDIEVYSAAPTPPQTQFVEDSNVSPTFDSYDLTTPSSLSMIPALPGVPEITITAELEAGHSEPHIEELLPVASDMPVFLPPDDSEVLIFTPSLPTPAILAEEAPDGTVAQPIDPIATTHIGNSSISTSVTNINSTPPERTLSREHTHDPGYELLDDTLHPAIPHATTAEAPIPTSAGPSVESEVGHEVQSPHDDEAPVQESEPSDFQAEPVASKDVVPAHDPHEISEGVYIDPPPAVLLSLSAPSGHVDYCLFNQPLPTLSSQTPAADIPGYQTYPLLLHHRPILYYEPLSVVFEALRAENCVQNLPEFADAELALDAYDLQLVISEDNVYANEVTIHELNVVHDGSDLSASPSLQLQLVSPRFITRYNALRDEIARLNLVTEGEQYSDQTAHHEEEYSHDTSGVEGGEMAQSQESPTSATHRADDSFIQQIDEHPEEYRLGEPHISTEEDAEEFDDEDGQYDEDSQGVVDESAYLDDGGVLPDSSSQQIGTQARDRAKTDEQELLSYPPNTDELHHSLDRDTFDEGYPELLEFDDDDDHGESSSLTHQTPIAYNGDIHESSSSATLTDGTERNNLHSSNKEQEVHPESEWLADVVPSTSARLVENGLPSPKASFSSASQTLSKKSSKRYHDELDDLDDDSFDSPPSSPGSKRLRLL